MPTLNTYTDDRGYYIQARLPDVGYVTYQVTRQATAFITGIGYSDGEELPWGLINPLKEAGEVYTYGTGTGTEQQNQSVPELSPGSLPKLSEPEADALIQYLKDATEVGSDTVNQVKTKINTEPDEKNEINDNDNDSHTRANTSDEMISHKSEESYFSLDEYEEKYHNKGAYIERDDTPNGRANK
jgi:hypothetical protein